MKKVDDDSLSFWGLACILLFAPLVRGGYPAWAALSVVAVTAWLWAALLLVGFWRKSLFFTWSREDALWVLGLSWVLFSLTRPQASPDGLDSLLVLLGSFGIYLLARRVSFAGSAVRLISFLNVTAGVLVLFGLLQIFGIVPRGWWNPPQFMASTFVNHNHFAAYLEILFPIGLLLWLTASLKPWERFVLVSSNTLMAIGLILSLSRGAWLSLILSIVGVLAWASSGWRSLRWDARKILIFFSALFLLGFLATRPPILSRALSFLGASDDPSVQLRPAMWRGTWKMATEDPLLGKGLRSFYFMFPRHRPAGLYRLVNQAHNEYLQVWVEEGAVGFFLAGVIVFFLFRRIVRLTRLTRTPWKRGLGWGGLMGFGSIALHSFIDFPLHVPSIVFLLSALAGLVTGVRYHADPFPLRWLHLRPKSSGFQFFRWAGAISVLTIIFAFSWPLGRFIGAEAWAGMGYLDQAVSWAPHRILYFREWGDQLMGRARQSEGDEKVSYLKEAEEVFRRALRIVPHDAPTAQELANVLKDEGRLEEAERWLKWSLQNDPNNPLYWKRFGDLKLEQGDALRTVQAFRRARRLAEPFGFFPHLFRALDHPDSLSRRGEAAWLGGNQSLARTAFTAARVRDPGHASAQVGLAMIALEEGDLEKAKREMVSIHEPALRAKWFAALALHHYRRSEETLTREAIATGLKLDSANVLARHLEFLLAQKKTAGPPQEGEILNELLNLNRPPVSVGLGLPEKPSLIWEPAKGEYPQGHRSRGAWSFTDDGAIHQRLILPPGKVSFDIEASGTRARGVAPTMIVHWSGRRLETVSVPSESWTHFHFETEVRPGEDMMTVEFINHYYDILEQEDRNLFLKKVVVSWEPL